VWNSLADDLIKQAGPNHCSTEGHAPEVIGTRAAFFYDVFYSSSKVGTAPGALIGAGAGAIIGTVAVPGVGEGVGAEIGGALGAVGGSSTIVAPQGDYWYRDDWQPCKTNILAAGKRERRELYNRIYRQWHYRMDWERFTGKTREGVRSNFTAH
jgi:hypothetical protein